MPKPPKYYDSLNPSINISTVCQFDHHCKCGVQVNWSQSKALSSQNVLMWKPKWMNPITWEVRNVGVREEG
jgi:hypothetical protein